MTLLAIALVVGLVATGALIPLLQRAGLHDVPNARSSHTRPTPRGGGLAVMLAVAVALAVGAEPEAFLLFVPALLLALLGLADDRRSLPSGPRLAAQAAIAIVGCVVVAHGAPSADVVVVTLVGTIAVLSYVNAFNFMDGINGISALNAAVCGGWLAWVGDHHSLPPLVVVGFALLGGALGFLPWNARSRVFLGDVGSYGIGSLIALACVYAWSRGVPWYVAVAPSLVYLADTGYTLLRRAQRGSRLTEAHREHVYQRLVIAGWPHLVTAAWTAALALVCCLLMLTAERTGSWAPALGVVLVLVAYLTSARVVAAAGVEPTA